MIKIFEAKSKTNRIYGLDILRCLAILFVVFAHGNLYFPKSISKYLDFFLFDGVSLFFVLSGFLIGGILIRELETKQSRFSLFKFWRNRWFRTLPAYFLVLTTLVIIDFANNASFPNLWNYLFFIQNLNSPHPEWFQEAWSLSVEEWFYIIVPFLLFISIKFFNLEIKNSVLIVSSLILICVTVNRTYNFYELNNLTEKGWDLTFRKQVFFRLDSLMYGVLGAYLYKYANNLWFENRKYYFVLGIIIAFVNKFCIPFDSGSLYSCVFSFSVDSLATLFLLPYLNEIKNGNGILYRLITGIALISYSMYLVNYSLVMERILKFVSVDTNNNQFDFLMTYFLFWSITILLSLLIYNYCEVPMMKLRNRLNKIKI